CGTQNQCDELRRREQPVGDEAPIGVTAVDLEDEPAQGVEQRVGQDYFAVEALPATETDENREQDKAERRLIQLDRMERHAERRSTDPGGVGIGEGDAP